MPGRTRSASMRSTRRASRSETSTAEDGTGNPVRRRANSIAGSQAGTELMTKRQGLLPTTVLALATEHTVATYDSALNRLKLVRGKDEASEVDVTELENFVGRADTGKPFEWGEQHEYTVLREGVAGRKWVLDRTDGSVTGYREFVTAQKWRRFRPGNRDSVDVVSEVPESTYQLPLEYFKLVPVKHVQSIAKSGLEGSASRVRLGLSSGNQEYAKRDSLLGAATWLGTTTVVGESMQEEGSPPVLNLRIVVPEAFRDAYLRDSQAVLLGNSTKVGDTAISFSPVPARYLTLDIGSLRTAVAEAKMNEDPYGGTRQPAQQLEMTEAIKHLGTRTLAEMTDAESVEHLKKFAALINAASERRTQEDEGSSGFSDSDE
ncbi:hypothetical protein ACSHWB_35235 [Lentzea sp. HUAS TT2]|uniref:hypothetical protein n=1 Tax=Lentzea sp. HUAS TT2 TaxID=3447454 RepID=UPI003F715D72